MSLKEFLIASCGSSGLMSWRGISEESEKMSLSARDALILNQRLNLFPVHCRKPFMFPICPQGTDRLIFRLSNHMMKEHGLFPPHRFGYVYSWRAWLLDCLLAWSWWRLFGITLAYSGGRVVADRRVDFGERQRYEDQKGGTFNLMICYEIIL